MRSFARVALALAALLAGCGGGLPASCPRGKGITGGRAVDGTTVEVSFACRIDEGSAGAGSFSVGNFTVAPPAQLTVERASADGGRVRLTTAPLTALVSYTVQVHGVRDADGNSLDGSANFVGVGQSNTAEITFEVDDRYSSTLTSVVLLASVDPLSGVFSHSSARVPAVDPDGDHVFKSTVRVAVDPGRTVDSTRSLLGPQHMPYSVRAVDSKDRPLSQLVLFEVSDTNAKVVKVPLLSVPKPPAPEGLVTVTFQVDDRPAQALSSPALKASIDADGRFDPSFATTIALADPDGDHIWTATAKVRIDPARVLGGSTPDTQPYSITLVESGAPYSARSADFVVPDEKAVSASILVGNKDKVPVTFRVDVSKAWLKGDGVLRGIYPGEAVFLTGEFGVAEDAFGQNAADAFNGGENVVLQMTERKDHPGVWERTIFLPRGRPYGWKVVRCPKDKGCTQLNKMVTSTGRAFPTVMKNLITELCDASKATFSDPECKSPKLIDPRNLTQVQTGAGVLDYSNAKIHEGSGGGIADQKDPKGTPSATVMFKQETPDLVADVKDQPLSTPVYVIGTWRDMNLPGTPADIAASGKVLELSKTDYDAGLIGVAPPTYTLPPPPKPSPFKMDGQLDSSATLVAGGTSGTLPLYLAISGNHLYLATSHVSDGSDKFILLSATAAGGLRAAPWGKAGSVALGGGKTIFLADENDNAFGGWFELASPSDKLLASIGGGQSADLNVAKPQAGGGVLEGTVELAALFGSLPGVIYVAVAPYGTADNAALYAAAQTPPTKDGNGNVDGSEILKVSLPSLKVLP